MNKKTAQPAEKKPVQKTLPAAVKNNTAPRAAAKEMREAKEEKKRLAEELAEQITYHQDLYYNGEPEISDDAFDALWDRLREIDPDHPALKKVGEDAGFFPKKEHLMPMGSLEKASDEEAFLAWAKTHEAPSYSVQHKLDGASLELQYENGALRAAVTRGNGITGDDILINARRMQGVPKTLPKNLQDILRSKTTEKFTPMLSRRFAVRGEVIMTHAVHKKYFSDKANCRNAANGLMRKKDGTGVEHLEVCCYDLWFADEPEQAVLSEEEKISVLRTLGFFTAPHENCADADAVIAYRTRVADARKKLGYDIDGLVVKMPYADAKDMQSLRPDRQIAFKFPLDTAVTTLLGVEWSESGHLYTPVALLEPVRIAGTTVQRANLVHPDHIQELGIKIGSQVLVAKRGEIIPKVESLVHTPERASDIELPAVCSACGTEVVNEGTRVLCPNPACPRRLLFRVQRWITVNEIDFWGEALLRRLVLAEKLIRKTGDLYRLTEKDLLALDRIGEPLAKKLLSSLHRKKTLRFEKFIASLGIDGVALVTAEKLVLAGICDRASLFAATEPLLSGIEGIGDIMAKTIVEGVKELKDEIDDLLSLIAIEAPAVRNTRGTLAGMSFCFTGTLIFNNEAVARKDLERAVYDAGGTVKSAVTKDLTYLVAADALSNSGKNKKAAEYGVTVLSAEEFFSRVNKK